MYFSNEAGFRLIDEEPCDYKGRTCYEVFFGIDHPCDNCRLEQTKKGITKCETYVPEADKTFLTNTEIAKWDGHDVLIEYITDISAIKEKQNELKQSKALYQKRLELIMQAFPNALGSLVMNLTQNQVYSQKRLYSFIREQSDKSISDYLEELKTQMPPEEFERYQRVFSRQGLTDAYNDGKQSLHLTHQFRFEDRVRWITTTAYFLVNPVSMDLEAYVFAMDDTDKVLTNQISQQLLYSRNDIVALIYPNDGFVDFRYTGNEFEKIPQMSIGEYEKNRHQSAALFGPESANDYIQKTDMTTILHRLSAQGSYSFTMAMPVEKTTRYKKYEYSFLSKEHEIILSTVQDVTDIYEKEKEQKTAIESAMRQAEVANAAKSDFLSRMSHDIRTPLNAVLGYLAIAKEQENDPAALDNSLSKIEYAGKYLLQLINDILDMSKIESGKVEIHETVVNQAAFLKSIVDMFAAQAEAKNIALKTDVPADQTRWVYLDELRTRQLYSNLLNNAIKYSDPDTTITWTIQNGPVEEGRFALVSTVKDQGCGMSSEFLTKIFRPFEQEENAHSQTEGGTGLGLAIVKNLVDLMGGTISVQSEPGKGSTFTIRINRRVADAPKEQGTCAGSIDTAVLAGCHVLLCEDHPMNREIAKRLLEKKGMVVDTATNGQESVSVFAQSFEGYYRAILMDVRMPVMNGLEATAAIRRLNREDANTVPIIAMTANAFEEDVQECLKAGMNAHLSKPIDAQLLYQAIAKELRRK